MENKKEILQHSPLTSTASIVKDIQAALDATGDARGVFGSRFQYDDEVGSTNDLAMRAAERGEPEGAVFVAGAQTAGRGRLGRTWFSPPGAGLYVSTIVRRPALAPSVTGARIEWNGADGAPLSGVTAGLASDGALLARTPAGIERILSGEIRWV